MARRNASYARQLPPAGAPGRAPGRQPLARLRRRRGSRPDRVPAEMTGCCRVGQHPVSGPAPPWPPGTDSGEGCPSPGPPCPAAPPASLPSTPAGMDGRSGRTPWQDGRSRLRPPGSKDPLLAGPSGRPGRRAPVREVGRLKTVKPGGRLPCGRTEPARGRGTLGPPSRAADTEPIHRYADMPRERRRQVRGAPRGARDQQRRDRGERDHRARP